MLKMRLYIIAIELFVLQWVQINEVLQHVFNIETRLDSIEISKRVCEMNRSWQ